MKHCFKCLKTESGRWWKCCPEHVTEQGNDVVCEACLVELHPKYMGVMAYGSEPHNAHIAKGFCDSISKQLSFCRFKANHKGLHLPINSDGTFGTGNLWQPKDELPRVE